MAKIAEASERQDIAELERLMKAAKRAQELEAIQRTTAAELDHLTQNLSASNPGLQPSPQNESAGSLGGKGSIKITIDWPAAGYSKEKVVIEDRKGSRALVGFLCEIQATLGDAALEKLSRLRISRGPLVSLDPESDFVNRGSSSVYMHHPVGQSRYYVITHNGTAEKIDAIHSAARVLGLKDIVKAQRS